MFLCARFNVTNYSCMAPYTNINEEKFGVSTALVLMFDICSMKSTSNAHGRVRSSSLRTTAP